MLLKVSQMHAIHNRHIISTLALQ